MADLARRHGFEGLGAADPGGPLAVFAAPAASQAVLRGRPDDAAFRAAAEAALGFALPDAAQAATVAGARTACRLGPDQWLVVDDNDAGFGRRIAATAGLIGVEMSSARARARLRGGAARELLAVGAAIDLRPARFPAGAFAQTTVGNDTVLLHARATDVFDLYVGRSYARSWLAWLAHAGAEFGLRLGGET